MRNPWAGMTVLFLAALQGCAEHLPISARSSSPAYSVLCVLSNAVSPTRVAVYPVSPMDSASFLVEGAEVVLWWAEGSAKLAQAEVENSLWGGTFAAYADTAGEVRVSPGCQFFLRVLCPDGTEINGQTTVPGDFAIVTPQAGDTLAAEGGYVEFRVCCSRSPGASGYVVEIAPSSGDSPGSPARRLRHSYIVLGDTTRTVQYRVRQNLCGPFSIRVMAFDRNYYEHVLAGAPAAGVENAFGVMGSCWTKGVTVWVRAG